MKKILIAIIFALSISISAFAQKADDKKDVLAVIDKMFAEMANHNPAAIAALYTADSNLTAIIRPKKEKIVCRSFRAKHFPRILRKRKTRSKKLCMHRKTEFSEIWRWFGAICFLG